MADTANLTARCRIVNYVNVSAIHSEFHRLLAHPDAHAKILSRHLLKRSTLFRNALLVQLLW